MSFLMPNSKSLGLASSHQNLQSKIETTGQPSEKTKITVFQKFILIFNSSALKEN
jgi:hypothetical protein